MKLNKILSIVIIITLIIGELSTANAQTISIIPEPYQMTTKPGNILCLKALPLMHQVQLTPFQILWL